MRKSWLFLAALFIVLAAVSYATAKLVYAVQNRVDRSAPPGLSVLQDYLQLTDAQRESLAQVDARFASTRPELRANLETARDKLLSVMRDPNSTRDEAVRAAREFGAAQQAMQLNTIEYTYELRKHLTPAQRNKLVATMGRGMCAVTCGPGGGRGMGGPGIGRGRMSGPGGWHGGR